MSALLEVRELHRHFASHGAVVRAVEGVSFSVHRGETVALVGESGCGKTTTARTILRLIEATSGSVTFDGEDVRALDREGLIRFRRRAQIVFQDPFGSLNPRLTAGATLDEVLRVHRLGAGPAGRRARVVELMDQVGLSAEQADRHPHEFSGGQRQRLGIARALAVDPEFLVLDEPVSALDVSVRAQIVNLLADLQERLGLTYLLIAHDLGVVEQVADRIAVMYLGRIVELASTRALFDRPLHPYTRALLAAVPRLGGERPSPGGTLVGDPPDPARPPAGCPFHPRCPDPRRDAECEIGVPPLRSLGGDRFAACVKVSYDDRTRG